MITPEFVIQMLLVGAGVGLISNSLGLGGGVLMVPAMVLLIPGMEDHTAKGTSLFIIIFVAAINAWRLNAREDQQLDPIAIPIAAGSVVASFLAGWLTQHLPNKAVSVMVALIALGMALRTWVFHPKRREEPLASRTVLGLGVGGATGMVSGATGIGGGGVLVPLALLTGLANNKQVVALSNTVMVATCLAGAIPHFFAEPQVELPGTIGRVNIIIPPLIIIGATAVGPLGRLINAQLTYKRRRVALTAVLLFIAATLTYRVFR